MTERFLEFPAEENLGHECEFWDDLMCDIPLVKLRGRLSCEGIIDPVCIFLQTGEKVDGFDLTDRQVLELINMEPTPKNVRFSIPASKPIEL